MLDVGMFLRIGTIAMEPSTIAIGMEQTNSVAGSTGICMRTLAKQLIKLAVHVEEGPNHVRMYQVGMTLTVLNTIVSGIRGSGAVKDMAICIGILVIQLTRPVACAKPNSTKLSVDM